LLTLCTSALQDHPLAANDHFANWRLAASAAQNAALAGSTRAKCDSSWRRYECFLGRIGQLLEPFFGRLGRTHKIEVFASFAAALRERGWVPDNVRDLAMDESPALFVPPSTVWLRPSGFTILRAPFTTPQGDLNQFWHCN
jgi:hypothetical protein